MTAPFRFKQFTVHQQAAAMKVGFDSILLGSWAALPQHETSGRARPAQILDVGTGTGLLALMIAQRTCGVQPPPQIAAVELDTLAADEARRNVGGSAWADRITVYAASVQQFLQQHADARYDLIICNPPYFPHAAGVGSNQPAPRDCRQQARRQARQQTQLTLAQLVDVAHASLTERGTLCVVIPFGQLEELTTLAAARDLSVQRGTRVRALPHKPPHRALVQLGRQDRGESSRLRRADACEEFDALTIEREHHAYTDEFRQLAKDFYLKF